MIILKVKIKREAININRLNILNKRFNSLSTLKSKRVIKPLKRLKE
jgi:hypothetical protein